MGGAVPVHDVVLVEVVDCEQDLVENLKGFLLAEAFLLFEVLEQLLALDELADDVVVLGVLVHAEDLDNVGVVLPRASLTSSRRMLNSFSSSTEMPFALSLSTDLIAHALLLRFERPRKTTA